MYQYLPETQLECELYMYQYLPEAQFECELYRLTDRQAGSGVLDHGVAVVPPVLRKAATNNPQIAIYFL